jgi:hypothetical protein
MHRSVREIVRARVEELDDWDDGDGFVMASDVGARIISYTGSKGWDAGAGHRPPSIVPVLVKVFEEIRGQLRVAVKRLGVAAPRPISAAENAFIANPNFDRLVQYAEYVYPLVPFSLPAVDVVDEEDDLDVEDFDL